MSLADCVKCWDNPCTCGYDYAEWPITRRIELAAVILGISKNELYNRVKDLAAEHPLAKERAAEREKQAEVAKAWLDDIVTRRGK